MIYQTTTQSVECDKRQHIRDCNFNYGSFRGNYETLVNGDVIEFSGVRKVVEREEVMRFAVVVYFTDGTCEDKINLFFAKDAKRISKRVGNLIGVYLPE